MFVKITDDHIAIYRKLRRPTNGEQNEEIVGWHRSEWEEDPSIVPSIANAIKLAYFKPTELLEKLGKIRNAPLKKPSQRGPNTYQLWKLGVQKYTLVVNELETWDIYTYTLDYKLTWYADKQPNSWPAFREPTKKQLIQRILDHYKMTTDDRH